MHIYAIFSKPTHKCGFGLEGMELDVWRTRETLETLQLQPHVLNADLKSDAPAMSNNKSILGSADHQMVRLQTQRGSSRCQY